VSDDADSHKDKVGQKYTAGTAAACMRSLLEQWATIDQPEGNAEQHKDSLRGYSSCHLDTPSEAACSQSTYHDEAYHSQENYDTSEGDLLQGNPCPSIPVNPNLTIAALPTIESSFKNALACFKQYRKCLPRDTDLKSRLKTQRVVFSSDAEILLSDPLDSVNDHLGSSKKVCLEVTLAIRTKLEEIEDITTASTIGRVESSQDPHGSPRISALPHCPESRLQPL
jgi:hypothetical protein